MDADGRGSRQNGLPAAIRDLSASLRRLEAEAPGAGVSTDQLNFLRHLPAVTVVGDTDPGARSFILEKIVDVVGRRDRFASQFGDDVTTDDERPAIPEDPLVSALNPGLIRSSTGPHNLDQETLVDRNLKTEVRAAKGVGQLLGQGPPCTPKYGRRTLPCSSKSGMIRASVLTGTAKPIPA